MKLVDVPDSKSGVVHPTCRFDSGHRHFLLHKCILCGVEPSAPRIKRIRLAPFILCSACGSFLSQNDTQSFCSAEWPSANKKRHKCVSFYLAYARVVPQKRSFVSSADLRTAGASSKTQFRY